MTDVFDRLIARLVSVQDNVAWLLLAVLVVQAAVFVVLIAVSFALLLRASEEER